MLPRHPTTPPRRARAGCRGTRSGAKATVKAWLNSPEHRAILLSPTYRWVGIGRNCGSYLGHPDACAWTADLVNRW